MSRFVWIALTAALAACPGPDSSTTGSASEGAGCVTDGNTPMPEGGYDCLANSILRCDGGIWVDVVYCGALTWTSPNSGFSYSCRCAWGNTETECTYGGATCGGQTYPTCGPNYHSALVDGLYRCVHN